jgi:hypothetical protein
MSESRNADNGRLATREIERSVDAGDDVVPVVVEAVAEVSGRSLDDLPPLQAVMDGDALNSLFAPGAPTSNRPALVEFEYADCQVRYRSDGRVTVRRPDR